MSLLSKKFLLNCPHKPVVLICRLCLLSDGEMGPIHFDNAIEWQTLSEKIRKFTSVELVPFNNTIYPVCEFCREQLNQCEAENENEYIIPEIELESVVAEHKDAKKEKTEPEPAPEPVIKQEPVDVKPDIVIKQEVIEKSSNEFELVEVKMEPHVLGIEKEEVDVKPNLDELNVEVENKSSEDLEKRCTSHDEAVKPNVEEEYSDSSSISEMEEELDEITLERGKKQCIICRRWIWNLNEHMNVHTKEKFYPCDKCPQTFYLRSKLRSHKVKHKGSKVIKCELCGKYFKESSQLQNHMIVRHNQRPYVCPICPRKFKRKNDMLSHARTHPNDRPHECDGCGKRFIKTESLARHIVSNSSKSPLNCLKCNHTFKLKCSLDIHIRANPANHNDLPCQCGLCFMSFDSERQLYNHVFTEHTKGMAFNCNKCEHTFLSFDSLENHTKNHSSGNPKGFAKPYKCFFCNKYYKIKITRDRHAKTHILVNARNVPPSKAPDTSVKTLLPPPAPQVSPSPTPQVSPSPPPHMSPSPDNQPAISILPQQQIQPSTPPPMITFTSQPTISPPALATSPMLTFTSQPPTVINNMEHNNLNFIVNTTPTFNAIGQNDLINYMVPNNNFIMNPSPIVMPIITTTDQTNNLNYAMNSGYYFFIVP